MPGEFLSYGAQGASLGSVFGPAGSIVGGIIGGITGLVLGSQQKANEKASEKLQLESDILGYKTILEGLDTEVAGTQQNISAYEDFLAAFPNYADLQRGLFEADARAQFRGLRENFAIKNVDAGATGRVGGSAGLIAEEARGDLAAYAGEDLDIATADGAIYDMSKSELWNNLDITERQYRGQMGVLQTSLSNLEDTIGLYQQALASAESRLAWLSAPASNSPAGGDIASPGDKTTDETVLPTNPTMDGPENLTKEELKEISEQTGRDEEYEQAYSDMVKESEKKDKIEELTKQTGRDEEYEDFYAQLVAADKAAQEKAAEEAAKKKAAKKKKKREGKDRDLGVGDRVTGRDEDFERYYAGLN